MIDDCINNSADYRFQIRYKMFPVEELAEEIRLFYNKWQEIEFSVYSSIMEPFVSSTIEDSQKQKKVMFIQFRGFCSSIICEILLSGMTMNDQLLRIHWEHFFVNTFGKEKEYKI